MNEASDEVTLVLPRAHFDFIMNVLGTAPLRYVDVGPVINVIAQQQQAVAQESAQPNGTVQRRSRRRPTVQPVQPNGAADSATVQ